MKLWGTGTLERKQASNQRVGFQQLREAPHYLIFDCGSNFNEEVITTIRNFGIEPKQTSFRSPWQNGVAERWVGNCRRDLLDHVIVLNERRLKGHLLA